ncbi:NAD(P)H-hydrate dehydratase [Nosocomiicoccus ampullae]|uniref:NAD(P)H-hydrate dehydratase n=1 Tax=Nosocomiicoccus ampullae TaxID=489910 RepID=UPI001C5E319D|nr:NAD(P)H-hydrate dehydratase [Nosocomiicoccus ampullae]QYA48297.1 NAD(P)H-hydrate dehydratase [Nosocomiicoccus ampullae]
MNKFELKDVVELWPNRDENSYKGTFGKVGIIAGSIHMPGASVFCTKAAVRSGAGLTTANIPKENFTVLGMHVPEAMLYNREDNLEDFYEGLDSILIGPGLGDFDEDYLKTLIQKFKGILVIDADGLTHVKPLLKYIRERTAPIVITPHFGEMARILDVNIQEVINNQKEVAKRFAEENNVYVVLKGSETVVSSPTSTIVLNRGNTGLSKGGSGDVLAGMILGFSNRYENLTDAIHSAVFMHGYTAEYVSKFKAVEAMTAMDIVNYLGESMLHVKK